MTSSNVKLISAYFSSLERECYYGTVEVTLQAGRVKFTREIKSKQDFEIAAAAWDDLSSDVKSDLREKFKDNTKFQELMRLKT